MAKIDELKSKQLLRRDREILARMIEGRQADFDERWDERKTALTRNARLEGQLM